MRTAGATAPPPTPQLTRRVRPFPWWVLALVLGAVVASYLAYHGAFSGDARTLGWDPFAYMWQARAVAFVGPGLTARPGVPLLDWTLAALVHSDPTSALGVLALAMPVLLGAAAAVAVRAGVRAPASAVPLVILVVATWVGTGRNAAGYYASFLAAVFLVAASGLLALRRARPVTGALLVAGFLAHPLFFALFAGLSVATGVLSFLVDRPWSLSSFRRAFAAPLLVLLSGAIGSLLVFVAAGVSPGEVSNLGNVSAGFLERTSLVLERFRPWLIGPAIAVGAAVTWSAAKAHGARDTALLWLTWVSVTIAGVVASLMGVGTPGARLLLFAVPLAILAALGAFGAAAVVWPRSGRERSVGVVRAALALAVIGLVLAALVPLGPGELSDRGHRGKKDRVAASHLSAYLERVPGDRPVVVPLDQTGVWGAYRSKYLVNLLRTFVPDRYVTRTVVYLGSLENLSAGRPSLAPPGVAWSTVYDDVSRRTWADVEPLLRENPVIVILQPFSLTSYQDLSAHDPTGVVAGGVYSVRGPRLRVHPRPPPPPLTGGEAAHATALFLVTLALAGSGWALTAMSAIGLDALDVVVAAPVVGAAAFVLAEFAVALSPVRLGRVGAWPIALSLVVLGWVTWAFVARRTGHPASAP